MLSATNSRISYRLNGSTKTAAAALRARLGKDYDDFEETLNRHLAQYAKAYYLFGVGLRQEVLSALGLAG